MGATLGLHSPINPTHLQCWRHHHLQWRSSLRSLQIQAVLRHLLSRLGTGWVFTGPGPNAAKVWMDSQFRRLDQPLNHVHHHGCRCTLSAFVLGRWKFSWLQRQSRPGNCKCRRCLPSCFAFCWPSRSIQLWCFHQRSDAGGICLRWSQPLRGVHVRDETPSRFSKGHVGGAMLHLPLLHALRVIYVWIPRPIPPKSLLPRNLTIQLANRG